MGTSSYGQWHGRGNDLILGQITQSNYGAHGQIHIDIFHTNLGVVSDPAKIDLEVKSIK